ncbi:MAG: IMP dehydrogenase [Nanoarchaeota archaeon]
MSVYPYSKISLVPNYGILKSRQDAKTMVAFNRKFYRLPVCVSNMSSVMSNQLAKWMSENEYFYLMHRFNGIKNKKDLKWFIEKANNENWCDINISLGVKLEDSALIDWIIANEYRVDAICLDIAHGWSVNMKGMLSYINSVWKKNKPFIIAGNVATKQAIIDLNSWGADCCKVFIGPGYACETYKQTGFATLGTFSTALACCDEPPCSIILDGGIRDNGDFTKSLVAGMQNNNHSVLTMAGSLFAACVDSPAETWSETGDVAYKIYYGSASRKNGNRKNIEGREIMLECNSMTYEQKLKEIEESLQSAISYAGGSNLEAFKNVKWVINES